MRPEKPTRLPKDHVDEEEADPATTDNDRELRSQSCLISIVRQRMRREHFEVFDRPFAALTELEKLAVAKMRSWSAYPSVLYPASPPTAASVAKIERDLGMRIPESYISLARVAPNYGVWFGSIGEDYSSRNHILWWNSAFRVGDEEYAALPETFVILNHGHDGDCDCWKVDELIGDEHPIYFISVQSPSPPKLLASSFLEYWKNHG